MRPHATAAAWATWRTRPSCGRLRARRAESRSAFRRAAWSRLANATGARMMVTAPIVVVDGCAGDVVPTTVTRRPAAASAKASFLTRVSVATSLATSMTTCAGFGRAVTWPSVPGESSLTENAAMAGGVTLSLRLSGSSARSRHRTAASRAPPEPRSGTLGSVATPNPTDSGVRDSASRADGPVTHARSGAADRAPRISSPCLQRIALDGGYTLGQLGRDLLRIHCALLPPCDVLGHGGDVLGHGGDVLLLPGALGSGGQAFDRELGQSATYRVIATERRAEQVCRPGHLAITGHDDDRSCHAAGHRRRLDDVVPVPE